MNKIFSILIIVALLGLGIVFGYTFYVQPQVEQPQSCTAEAKLCPDGSAVGRTGPKCEFAACPETNRDSGLFEKNIEDQISQCAQGFCEFSFDSLDKTVEQESYVACGCGCCGGEEPADQCIYRAKGESLEAIIKSDQAAKQNSECALLGCSFGVRYSYCD